jgi:uncharacterized membrane protein HdeD (DUF308 family)
MIFMGLSFAIMAIRQKSPNAMMLVNAGISSAFGLIIIFDPFKSPEFMNFVVGFGTIALGLYIIIISIRLRSKSKTVEEA